MLTEAVSLTTDLEQAYFQYAVETITDRALPRVEDGLKPVQRRILYAMHDMGLYHDKPHRKSARVVGECFIAGTPITTEQGLKPIEKVTVGERVRTQRGWRPVTALYEMPERDLLQVTLTTGATNVVTPSQKFKVLTPELGYVWKEAHDLTSNDYLVVSCQYPECTTYQTIEGPDGLITLNENLAYLLGQFLSDGWIEKGSNRLSFYSGSPEIVKRIASILQTELAYKATVEEKTYTYKSANGRTSSSIGYQIRINSRDICMSLAEQFGLIDCDAATKQIPPQILCSPESVVWAFISGLYDGDGSVHGSRNTVHYASVSESLIYQLMTLLQSLGILSYLRREPIRLRHWNERVIQSNHPAYFLEVRGSFAQLFAQNARLACVEKAERLARIRQSKVKRSQLEGIPYLAGPVFSELSDKHLGSGWYLDTEGNKFRMGIRYPGGSKIRYAKSLHETRLYRSQLTELGLLPKLRRIGSELVDFLDDVITNKLAFVPVASVEPAPSQKTFDLQVDDDHEFIAHGMVVHNCLGKYHPHGDQSVYMAMVRMAQDFAMRQPLIDGQGNFGCFTGDTEVKLLDGTDRTFEELARRYGPDEVFYVYSVDNDGNIVVGEGRYSRVTRQKAKVIELELDNGEIIRCTPGHRFMLHDGSYKSAQDLTEHDSLMAGYFSTYNNCFPCFEKAMTYFDSFDEFLALSKTYNHRVVAKRVLTKRFDVYDITVEPYHNFLLSSGVFVHNSIDGDLPAAMRYTEARLDEIAELVLQDIDKDTVDFVDNFDGSLKEPVILPAALPNLLVNGAMGIAVGMATNIPPHNLGEVCDAVAHVASHWRKRDKITVDELMEIIPGPDFPTGGVIYRYRDDLTGDGKLDTIRAAYETGRGQIVTQARVDVEDIGGGKFNIVVTELPYAVQKSTVLERIAREVREGKISGVTDLRDESDHEGMRVVIEVSRMADTREVLEGVLSRSQLRETFGVNALALVAERVNGDTIVRPQRLSLHDMLVYFVEHRLNIIVRRSRYELAKREARLHIVEGLLKALDVIDQVIDTIRRSRTSETAEVNLIKQFGFTRVQAEAILAMQLRRLAALERRKLADEEKELKERIKYLKELLRSEARRLEVVIVETTTIKEKFATPRKTVILTEEKPGGAIVTEAELAVPDGPQVVVVTMQGVQRNDAKSFSYRVKPGMTSRAVEAHWMHLHTEPEDTVVLVSNRGRAWWGGVGRLPRSASFEELGLSKGEQVVGTGVLSGECCLVLGTRRGQVKRVKVEDVKSTAEASWAMVIGLGGEDDVRACGVLFAGVGGDEAHVMFFGTSRANRFVASEVNPQATRSAKGMAGIKVGKGDRLLGGAVISNPTAELGAVVVSKNGYVKRVPLGEFPVQGRGGQGVLLLNQTKATGPVAAAMLGPMNGSVDLISADGKRQRLDEVPVTNRANRGEKLVELEEVAEVVVL